MMILCGFFWCFFLEKKEHENKQKPARRLPELVRYILANWSTTVWSLVIFLPILLGNPTVDGLSPYPQDFHQNADVSGKWYIIMFTITLW